MVCGGFHQSDLLPRADLSSHSTHQAQLQCYEVGCISKGCNATRTQYDTLGGVFAETPQCAACSCPKPGGTYTWEPNAAPPPGASRTIHVATESKGHTLIISKYVDEQTVGVPPNVTAMPVATLFLSDPTALRRISSTGGTLAVPP